MDSDILHIYTDGACSGNPGRGGWGVYIEKGIEKIELNGSEEDTTNNRMELVAVIQALRYVDQNSKIKLFTDSKYVMQGIQEWILKWKTNDWKTANKKDVKNKDLWMDLDELVELHNIDWIWVKGHSGDFGNEIADKLATSAISN